MNGDLTGNLILKSILVLDEKFISFKPDSQFRGDGVGQHILAKKAGKTSPQSFRIGEGSVYLIRSDSSSAVGEAANNKTLS